MKEFLPQQIEQTRGMLPWHLGLFSGISRKDNMKALRLFVHNPEVCIVFSLGHKLVHQSEDVACSYGMTFKSVIVNGKVEFEENIEKKTDIMNKIMMKYTGRIFEYSLPAIKNVTCYVVSINEITGRNRGM